MYENSFFVYNNNKIKKYISQPEVLLNEYKACAYISNFTVDMYGIQENFRFDSIDKINASPVTGGFEGYGSAVFGGAAVFGGLVAGVTRRIDYTRGSENYAVLLYIFYYFLKSP